MRRRPVTSWSCCLGMPLFPVDIPGYVQAAAGWWPGRLGRWPQPQANGLHPYRLHADRQAHVQQMQQSSCLSGCRCASRMQTWARLLRILSTHCLMNLHYMAMCEDETRFGHVNKCPLSPQYLPHHCTRMYIRQHLSDIGLTQALPRQQVL